MKYKVDPNQPNDGDMIIANRTWWRYWAVRGKWEDTGVPAYR
jgi:hypothetical protein